MDIDPAIPLTEISLEDLLNHPQIAKWKEPDRKYLGDGIWGDPVPKENFQFMWTPNDGKWSKACLMAFWIEGEERHWWVLGYMDKIPNLPQMTDFSKTITQ